MIAASDLIFSVENDIIDENHKKWKFHPLNCVKLLFYAITYIKVKIPCYRTTANKAADFKAVLSALGIMHKNTN